VQVREIIQPPIEWSPKSAVESNVLATVRGMENWPLVVEKSFGQGRAVVFTSTAGPVWNNWSRNATFPPIMLLLQDYLASGKYVSEKRVVGQAVELAVNSKAFTPNVTIIAPGGSDGVRLVTQRKMSVSGTDSEKLNLSFGKPLPSESIRETDIPGFYDVWMRRTDSDQKVERFSLNVDVAESEMALANRQKMLVDLENCHPTIVDWDEFNPEPKQKPASSLSKLLLLLLVIVLVAEQLLAYWTSYHQKS